MSRSDIRELSIFAHAEAVLNALVTLTQGTDRDQLEAAASIGSSVWPGLFEAVGAPYSEEARRLVLDELERRVRVGEKEIGNG